MQAHEIISKQHSSTASYETLLFVRRWDLHSTLSHERFNRVIYFRFLAKFLFLSLKVQNRTALNLESGFLEETFCCNNTHVNIPQTLIFLYIYRNYSSQNLLGPFWRCGHLTLFFMIYYNWSKFYNIIDMKFNFLIAASTLWNTYSSRHSRFALDISNRKKELKVAVQAKK